MQCVRICASIELFFIDMNGAAVPALQQKGNLTLYYGVIRYNYDIELKNQQFLSENITKMMMDRIWY